MLPEPLVRELADNLTRGLTLLDERDPTWWRTERHSGRRPIDLAELREESAVYCVVAQWAGADYFGGLAALGLGRGDAYRHGFTALAADRPFRQEEFHPRFGALTRLWRTVIAERRGRAITAAVAAMQMEVSAR